MSYDIAVWVGEHPADAAEALAIYEQKMDLLEADDAPAPDERLLAYADALLARYPDIPFDDEEDDDCPWAEAPLKNNVVGDIFYFAMVFSRADAALPFIAETAIKHGLVCFDPQTEQVLSVPTKRRGFFRRS